MDAEQILQDLENFLRANLSAQLRLIEGIKTDMKLGNVDEYIQNEQVDLDKYKKPTNIFLFFEDASLDVGPSVQTQDVTSNITLYMTFTGATPQVLTRKLNRYSLALDTLIANNRTLDGVVSDIKIQNFKPYYFFTGSENFKMMEVKIVIRTEI